MNKKLLIGLSSIGMAAGFWACGSGSIEPMDEGTDVYVDAMLNTLDFTSQTERAMKACDEDLVCANEMAKAAHGSIEFSSESSLPVSSDDSGQPIVSSSSESFFKFSSLGDVGFQSSSSDAGTLASSSSEQIIITGLGRCYPLSETIESNGQAQWKVEWGAPWSDMSHIRDVAAATYSWSFGMDATPDNNTAASPKVSYSKSGPKSASVDVVIGGQKGTIQCDKTVNVNGAPITGCLCTTTATSVDFLENPDVVWTVSGCKSQGQTTFFYSWEGGAAGAEASFTKTFTAAQTSYAPKLKVSHADNSIQEFPCTAVKVTEGPEYTLKDNTTTVFPISVGSYLMVYGCETSQYHQTPVVIKAPSGAMEVVVDGTKFNISQYGQALVYSSQTANSTFTVEVKSGSGEILCQ